MVEEAEMVRVVKGMQTKDRPSLGPEPVNVRVARLLGWKVEWLQGDWVGVRPGESFIDHIPEFDKSWRELGHIVEQMKVSLQYSAKRKSWLATCELSSGAGGFGGTALEAVCDLFIEMAEAGEWPGTAGVEG